MVQAIRKHTEGQRFDSSYGLLTSRAVNHYSLKLRYLRQPPAILFLFDLNAHTDGRKDSPLPSTMSNSKLPIRDMRSAGPPGD